VRVRSALGSRTGHQEPTRRRLPTDTVRSYRRSLLGVVKLETVQHSDGNDNERPEALAGGVCL